MRKLDWTDQPARMGTRKILQQLRNRLQKNSDIENRKGNTQERSRVLKFLPKGQGVCNTPLKKKQEQADASLSRRRV